LWKYFDRTQTTAKHNDAWPSFYFGKLLAEEALAFHGRRLSLASNPAACRSVIK
jgi:hypothetical protein